MSTACICGHSTEEHGHDPKYPGSTACQAKDCDCISYEQDEYEPEEDDVSE